MITLDATTDSLEVKLSGAITTNQLSFTTSYADLNTSTFAVTTFAENNGTTNNTTAVTLVAAPSASRSRKISLVNIYNADTVSATVTVQYNANGTLRVLCKIALAVDSTLQYTDGGGWKVITTSGGIVSTAGTHALLDGSVHSDTSADAVSRGSLIYGNATPACDELVIGAANRVLGSDGTDAAWVQADHGAALTGLSDDDHSQYALLAGRSGGQVITGGTASGDDLTLRSTSNATKGDVFIADAGGNVVIGGGTTASELRILEASGSGTNYTAFKAQAQSANITYTLPADDGDADQVLATNGSGTLDWVTPSGPPRMAATTIFEDTGRFIETVVSAGTVSYSTDGVELDTSATISSSAQLTWRVVRATNNGGLFTTFPTEFNCAIGAFNAAGTDIQMYFGLGEPTVGGAGITYTVNHIGFKIVRAASGAIQLFATQADGTETASSALTTVASDDTLDLALSVDGSASVRYWWRKNGGAWSSTTTLTTNVPTLATATNVSIAVSNAGVATRSGFQAQAMTVVR